MPLSSKNRTLTEKQRRVLQATRAALIDRPAGASEYDIYRAGARKGWFTGSPLFGHLKKVTDRGFLERERRSGLWRYRLTDAGREAIS